MMVIGSVDLLHSTAQREVGVVHWTDPGCQSATLLGCFIGTQYAIYEFSILALVCARLESALAHGFSQQGLLQLKAPLLHSLLQGSPRASACLSADLQGDLSRCAVQLA